MRANGATRVQGWNKQRLVKVFLQICLKNNFTTFLKNILKTFLKNILKTCLKNIFTICLKNIFKDCLKKIFTTCLKIVVKLVSKPPTTFTARILHQAGE